VFRKLATRLTATYVFAAIVLVVIVIAAVTAFVLSTFGVLTREASASVARQVPEEVRQQVARDGSFVAAAPDIARHLTRPGLRIVVVGSDNGLLRVLAESASDERGRADLIVRRWPMFVGPPIDRLAEGAPGPGGPAGFGPGPSNGPPPGAGPGFGAEPGNGPPPGAGPPQGSDRGAPSPSRQYERMPPFPFGLNALLRVEPQTVVLRGGHVTIVPDPRQLAHTINQFWIAMLPIGIFVVATAWLLGRYIAGQALRPLVQTTESLRRFGEGDFSPRPINYVERNEIGELAKAYNAAAAQVSAAFAERHAAEVQMRSFVADAGHELRTPLTVIMGYIDVLRRRAHADPANAKIFETMLAESRRMRALIEKLIVLARLENPQLHERQRETVDLAEIAQRVALAAQAIHAGRQVNVSFGEGGEALVRGDEAELYDALGNLVENALKYAPQSSVDVTVRGEEGDIVVAVCDEGPGIAAEEQPRIFDRFYRGRDRAEADGFGLGLAIAKRSVERSGGRLTVESEPGHGCRFTIRIARASRGEVTMLAV
jgi:two-component system OmpR family sensor kinase